jgi:hypothetical protein
VKVSQSGARFHFGNQNNAKHFRAAVARGEAQMIFGIYELEPQVGDSIDVEGFTGTIRAVMKSFDGSIRYIVEWLCYEYRSIIVEPDQIESLTRSWCTFKRNEKCVLMMPPGVQYVSSFV